MINRESQDTLLLEFVKSDAPTKFFAENESIVSGTKRYQFLAKLPGTIACGISINNQEQSPSGNHAFTLKITNDSGIDVLNKEITALRGNLYSETFDFRVEPFQNYTIQLVMKTTASSSGVVKFTLNFKTEIKKRIDRYLIELEG